MAKDQLRPRLCRMIKGEQGYGFHLHGEKGKSGQFIRKVEPGSPAEAAALRAGDRLVEVNGVNVEKETHLQVVQRIKAVEGETRLLVVDKETDEYLASLHLTCTEEMANHGVPPSAPIAPQDNGNLWEPQPETWPPRAMGGSFSSRKDVPGTPRELRPRLCHLHKGPNGYGFNLHSEKSRPGQYIRAVDAGSPAARSGLQAQDRLIEVNGRNVEGLRHAEVVSSIKAYEDEARLLVVDPETDAYFKRLRVVPTEEHVTGPLPSLITNGMSPPQDNDMAKRDPFQESGLHLSPTAAEAKEKARAKRVNKRAPQMDWNKKREIFSNF
ncbi:Na(+)/H(+) exchange regulatory cofactor NHE-RF2 isoform X2 [Phascolarctos cinereus]|uniref:Na(+)/H(+) exchange regulatory cofactor NHE-RF n=1 Tax=Phascolarctos cinereus TaxID=38626 RepID=A0A6P5LVF8_PHACI|nr:Na(+)/H(+) exchange regulatory cofactor NHE-RF2 isoform X2 [Phascolarctos cinereus]